MRIILDNDQVIEGDNPFEIVRTLAERDHRRTYEAKITERMQPGRDRQGAEAAFVRDYMDATRERVREQFGVEVPERLPLGFLRELKGVGIIKEIIE